jgi:hypothetical protein
MWVVTIRALHKSFFHPVMKRHIELRFHLQMAGVAKLRLRFHEQELICVGVMG